MNYLSHYLIDHQTNNHYYNTGLLLPDITKGQVKTFKKEPPTQLTENESNLLNGCLKHYESDKRFHSSSFFNGMNQDLNEVLKKAGFSVQLQRKWFLAHIFTELMIDRVIVKNYPHVTDGFYFSLNAIDNNILLQFLNKFEAHDTSIFLNRFNHFRQVQYIYYYSNTNKFVYSLTRIMMRAGLPEMIETDKMKLELLTEEIETKYFSDHAHIINELKKVFE